MKRLLAVLAGFVVLAVAVPAAAHVTVTAPGVTVGASDAQITFRVPTESATASTVGLSLQLPTDLPIAGVLVAPVPGWTSTVTRTTLATPITTDDGTITQVVSRIDWTAASEQGIKPDGVGLFTIVAGKLPDGASSLTFKAIQHYSDGTTVSWIEVAAPGSTTEPDHPAPVLDLAAASTSSAPATVAASAHSKSSTTAPTVLAVIALVLAAAALGVSVVTRAQSVGRP